MKNLTEINIYIILLCDFVFCFIYQQILIIKIESFMLRFLRLQLDQLIRL